MGRLAARAVMALVGVAVLTAYVATTAAVWLLLATLWSNRGDLATTLGFLVVLTLAFGYLSYRFGTARVLASVDAARLTPSSSPELYRRVDALCAVMDVERPTLLVAGLTTPNAFALGGVNGGAVVFDRRLFRLLSADEFAALAAHELAHLERNDGLVQTLAYSVARTLVGVLTFLALPALLLLTGVARGFAWIRGRPRTWPASPFASLARRIGQLLALAFVLATLFVRAHSRRRELAADERAAEMTDPLALARALRTIQRASEPRWGFLSTLSVRDDESLLTRLLSTHPPMDERIDRLVERAERAEASRWHRVEVE
ncbi:MAG: M48 family metallopeptidase [Haloferacaceae archaeon]